MYGPVHGWRRGAVYLPLLLFLITHLFEARPAVAGQVMPEARQEARQPGRVVGFAADRATGDAIAGVQIFIEGTSIGTVTDPDGRFVLARVPPGRHVFAARFVGYRTATIGATVNPGETEEIIFRLEVEAIRLQDVVVTAIGEGQDKSRIAASVETIGQEAIRRARPAHPSDIMNRIPGVWINTTSGEGHMTAIRQPLTTEPVYLFLENGVPTRSTGFFNHNALYEVNLPMARSVEVLKGPGTALYGSDAIGAVVNVSTRLPTDAPTAGLSVEGGAFGFGRMMLGTGATYGRHGVRLDFSGSKSDGWRDASRFDRQSGTLTWELTLPGVSRLRTVASFSHVDQEPAGASTLSEEDFERNPTINYTPISFRRVNAIRISSAFERLTGRTSVSLTPFVRFNEMEILPNWSLTYDPTMYATRNVSAGLLARYRRDLGMLDALLVTGVDVEFSPGEHVEQSIIPERDQRFFTSFTEKETIYDYDVSFRQASPYAHVEAEPVRNLRLSGGFRMDLLGYDYDNRLTVVTDGPHRRAPSSTRWYTHLSPKFGAVYRLPGFGSLFASYAHAFRVPSEGQLFRQGATDNTLDLQPVRADNLEIGIRGSIGKPIRFELSLYRMIKRDDIISFTNLDGTRLSTNAGKTSHRGIEAGLMVRAGAGITVQANHTVAIHKFEEWRTSFGTLQNFSGNEIDAAPRTITNVLAAYEPTFLPGSSISIEWTRLGDYFMDPANTMKYTGYSLFHLRATADLPAGFAVFGRLTNVTNERYADLASYSVARGPEYAPGQPRALYVGLEYRIRSER